MSRTTIDKQNRAIFGARFFDQFQKWKHEGEDRTQTSFGKLLDPPASRGSVMKWCRGDNIPTPDRIKQICEVFEVPDDYFDTDKATHEELYEHASVFITKIGRSRVEFAKKEGLNLDLVRALTKIVDFDKCFPLYSAFCEVGQDPETGLTKYGRKQNAKSAPIDEELEFLQIERDGKLITLSDPDLAFLKEVQNNVVKYVEFLFYDRARQMEIEEEAFNDDSIINLNDMQIEALKRKYPGVDIAKQHRITPEYIEKHDPYSKYHNQNMIRKATQEDYDRFFEGGGKTIHFGKDDDKEGK